MAYYLDNPSSPSSRVTLPSRITIGSNVGDYLEFSGFANSGNEKNNYRIVGETTGFNTLLQLGGSSVLFRPSLGFNSTFNTGYTQPPVGTDFIIKVVRSAVENYEIFIDGISIGVARNVADFTPDLFFDFGDRATQSFRGACYYIKISTDGGATVTHHYDPSATGGTGSVLEDTVGGNDGTLVAFPTDDSQWVFYDAGGGGGVVQEIVLIAANQANNSSTLSISSSNLLNAVTATQLSSASSLLIKQLQALDLITTQQINNSQLLSLEQQQSLQTIIATQINNAGITDLESAQAVSFIAATQSNTAEALNLDQLYGQVITLIAAEQVNEAQTILISQISSLEFLSANQINGSQALSISQNSKLKTINAQQINTAAIMNILASGDNTDLSGLELVQISEVYDLLKIKNEYSLIKK